jgi:hypothetical protein
VKTVKSQLFSSQASIKILTSSWLATSLRKAIKVSDIEHASKTTMNFIPIAEFAE